MVPIFEAISSTAKLVTASLSVIVTNCELPLFNDAGVMLTISGRTVSIV